MTAIHEIYLHKAFCEDEYGGESQLQSKLKYPAFERNGIVTEHVRICKEKSKSIIMTTASFKRVFSLNHITLTIRK